MSEPTHAWQGEADECPCADCQRKEPDMSVTQADRDAAEKLEWIAARGFRHALYDPPPQNGAAQFMRAEWEQPSIFALADRSLAFNVAGLYWRPVVGDGEKV